MCTCSTCISCQYVVNDIDPCKKAWKGWRGKKDNEQDGTDIASSSSAIRDELKNALEKERLKHLKKSEVLALAEASHDKVVEGLSAILLDQGSMDAMVAYGKNKDPKNTKGKEISEKWKELHELLSPAVKEKVRKIILERIKVQYKKDAKAAEKFLQKTLGKLFPDLLPKFFGSHDYNKGKRPEPE